MTLNDPLMKNLKDSIKPLLLADPITDDNTHLQPFCEALERIFHSGQALRHDRVSSPWAWMNAVAFEMERGSITRVFPYVRSVEMTRECQKVTTETGVFRQLVRCCLNFKSLHVAVEVMVRKIGERKLTWYQSSSVLGHDVLGEILLSVLLQASQLNFQLDLKNARFLDWSWQIPVNRELELVPCETLGLVVTFCHHLAVIAALQKGSVAAEEDKIEPGDVLDELNGQPLSLELRGKLKGIMNKNEPIRVRIVKTHAADIQKAFLPCVKLYRRSSDLAKLCLPSFDELERPNKTKEIKYLGCSPVGNRGDVSVVESGVQAVVADGLEPRVVRLECRELDITVYCEDSLLMRHCYVNVASCAHSIQYPKHFAYIVGSGPCSGTAEYTCHVFSASSHALATSTLLDISSGFDRTTCAA